MPNAHTPDARLSRRLAIEHCNHPVPRAVAVWQTVREWSEDNAVFVSEYAAPPDFVCVAERAKPSCLAGGHRQSPRTERLFTHAEGVAHATLPVLSAFTKVECAACPPR